MIILQGNNLSRLFGSEVLFENISIRIQSHSRIALVGRNGVGKSTLLKMLANIEQSDSGEISKIRDLSIGYLDQQSALQTHHTIFEEMSLVFADIIALHDKIEETTFHLSREEVLNNTKLYEETLKQFEQLQHELEERGGYSYESDIRTVLHGFKFYESDYNKPIASLSGGQKTRLAMAKLLLEKHDLLILDEPTNHLDIDTLSWLETYLKNYKGALLIVSHDRYFLDKVANEVYDMSQKSLHHYKGNYSFYLEEKEKRLEKLWKDYEKQQSEIAKLEDFIAKNIVRASTTKRAQSRRKLLDKMVRIDKPKNDDKSMTFEFSTKQDSGNDVLNITDGAIGYDKVLCEPVNLNIRKQEAVALIGPNGIGKSTLLKTILKQLPLLKGTLSLGTNVSIGYYDQEQHRLSSHKDVLHELWDEYPTTNEKDIRQLLGAFLFSGEDVLKIVGHLSGGEKARLLLAKLAMQHDNFLILDEPTNHLDLDSKEVLEEALMNFDGTILFISHDRYFINRIATSIVELSSDGTNLYLGDYDYYLEKKAEKETPVVATEKDHFSKEQSNYYVSKEFQKAKRQLERHIEQLETDMAKLENFISEHEILLSDPTIFSDFEKATTLSQELESYRMTYEQKLTDWETTHEELELLLSTQ